MNKLCAALLAVSLFTACHPLMAHAKATPDASLSIPTVPRLQRQAFMLGYALRLNDLQVLEYTHSVKALQDSEDPHIAGAEVAVLSQDVPKLRRTQAAAYALVSQNLDTMGAPETLRRWAAHSAATLEAPLVFSDEAKTLAKTEPDTASVLAELDEIRTVKADAEAQQTALSLWLKVVGGKVAPWTADVGSYAADLHHAAETSEAAHLPSGTARALLQRAPLESPAGVRDSLAAMIPSGGGNLQTLATVAPSAASPEKLAHVYTTLLASYGAETWAEALDKDSA